MKKCILTIMYVTILLQCYGQSQAKIEDKDFEKFVSKFTEMKLNALPVNCKPAPFTFFFFDKKNPYEKISLEESRKYLNYSEKDYYVTEYDYDMDEDRIFNIRQVENPPFANSKISHNNHICLMHLYSSSLYLNECDTAIIILNTFTLNGVPIDKITIQGHYTRELDWIDFVFLSNNTFKIFHYFPNLENYNIKGGAYYVIDEKKPQTIVEISDYQIDENGKISLIKTHPKQYLKEFVSFYRSYHENSDDPMNEY